MKHLKIRFLHYHSDYYSENPGAVIMDAANFFFSKLLQWKKDMEVGSTKKLDDYCWIKKRGVPDEKNA